jgi:hypothetical protein
VAYRDKVEFFLVYIREAHPVDARPGMAGNPARGDPDIKQPKTIDERVIAATKCLQDLKLTLPVLVDDMEGAAEKAYGGWPDRIAVIDAAGKIAYHCGPGPRGFNPAGAEQVLRALLANGGKWSSSIPAPAEPQPPGRQGQDERPRQPSASPGRPAS